MRQVQSLSQLGERIRHVRRVRGLSQDEAARGAGLTGAEWAEVEAGERQVSVPALLRMSEPLGITLPDLVALSLPDAVARRTPVSEEAIASERETAAAELDLDAAWSEVEQLRGLGLLAPVRLDFGLDGFDSAEHAVAIAGQARKHLGYGAGPLPGMADVAAQVGLWTRTTTHDVDGLSMTPEPGLGVCVVGARVAPGRRRATVAHEIGHHLSGDTYVGGDHATMPAEAEGHVDAFAAEFLLPWSVLQAVPRPSRDELIEIAGRYRVSWSAVVAAARRGGCELADVAVGRTPVRADFLAVLGHAPKEDLESPGMAAEWVRACAAAATQGALTLRRAEELARESLQ